MTICAKSRCTRPVSACKVVLLNPDGTDGKACGPYCDDHTEGIIYLLVPTYSGGGPAYRIDRAEGPT